ncbi:tyrosine-type recombinase/integrase [Nonlabens sp.]|uniref:tyrosine-type recombinase/integrase n=1 Tax=Nonlabens sp. TaxID=1888209 RepID=UPI003F69BEB0
MQTFGDFEKLLEIKKYAPNTIKTYIGLLIAFQKFVGINSPIDLMENHELVEAISKVVKEKKLSISTHKQLIAALNLYFKEMHRVTWDFNNVYPRAKPKPLPVVLALEDVKKILNASNNLKHRAMLTLVYALGLRSGELINLKITDLDKHRNHIHIRDGKNNKDRYVPFPDSLKPMLRDYYKAYLPKVYLFEGQNKPQYHAQSLRKVFHKACKTARIKKKVTLHSLRHAYATHLMDAGTDVRVIKELLGHSNLKTTMIYTHVTTRNLDKIPSPIDFL